MAWFGTRTAHIAVVYLSPSLIRMRWDAFLRLNQASPIVVGEDIGSSLWLNWELGGPHTAAVYGPSSLMRLVLPHVMMIQMIVDSSMLNWGLVPDQLHGQLASAVWESLIYWLTMSTLSLYLAGIWHPSSVGTSPGTSTMVTSTYLDIVLG